ncbi:MAG: hypothetical protein OXG81_09335 [Acidobacteria bacterium]|nr:hypothetical protein [Acidobacteriota bacterium]
MAYQTDTAIRLAAFEHVWLLSKLHRPLPGRMLQAMLEALKKLEGGRIRLPDRQRDCPDRDLLARRFELFKAA